MDSITLAKPNSKTIEIDDSGKHHGGVGVDFWFVDGDCKTEAFTLNVEEVMLLADWLNDWLAEG